MKFIFFYVSYHPHTKKANLRTYMAIFIENRLYVFYHYLSRHRVDVV